MCSSARGQRKSCCVILCLIPLRQALLQNRELGQKTAHQSPSLPYPSALGLQAFVAFSLGAGVQIQVLNACTVMCSTDRPISPALLFNFSLGNCLTSSPTSIQQQRQHCAHLPCSPRLWSKTNSLSSNPMAPRPPLHPHFLHVNGHWAEASLDGNSF